jgi:hypothetical protein
LCRDDTAVGSLIGCFEALILCSEAEHWSFRGGTARDKWGSLSGLASTASTISWKPTLGVPNYPFKNEQSLRWIERACAQARVIAGSPRSLGTAEAEYLLARLRRDEVIYVNGADGKGSINIEKDEEVLTHAMTIFLSELS